LSERVKTHFLCPPGEWIHEQVLDFTTILELLPPHLIFIPAVRDSVDGSTDEISDENIRAFRI
jgi:hypothetical protein